MIGNPCNWFITGSDKVVFIYEGGSNLYHFSPHDNDLTISMECNIMFFANDEKHALDVLKRMLNFRIAVSKKYNSDKMNTGSVHSEYYIDESTRKAEKAQSWVDAIDAGKIKLSLAPKDQFFKVTWASNDTIL
jgi:hypothetical protein